MKKVLSVVKISTPPTTSSQPTMELRMSLDKHKQGLTDAEQTDTSILWEYS